MSAQEQRLRKIVISVLGVPEESVEDASVDTAPSWDSITHMNLIMAVEQEFGVRFAAGDMLDLDSFARLRDAVAARRPEPT